MRPLTIFMIMFIYASGNPWVNAHVGGRQNLLILGFILSFAFWMRGSRFFTPLQSTILLLFGVISLMHFLMFGVGVVTANLGFILQLLTVALVTRAIPDFHARYVNILSVLALVSFAFQLPIWLGIDISTIVRSIPMTDTNASRSFVFFHTYIWGTDRNSGPFWEPGAFAGYLILAILLLQSDKCDGLIFSKRMMYSILSAGVISTGSTTGVIALMAIFGLFLARMMIKNKLLIVVAIVVLPLLAGGVYYVYMHVPFLGEKISHQLSSAIELRYGWQTNRLGNFLFDLEYIRERPILGWSPSNITRGQNTLDIIRGQGNGLSGMAVDFGLFGLSVYIASAFLFFMRWLNSIIAAILSVFVIVIVLNGEQFLNFYLFWTVALAGGMKSPNSPPYGLQPRSDTGREEDFDSERKFLSQPA